MLLRSTAVSLLPVYSIACPFDGVYPAQVRTTRNSGSGWYCIVQQFVGDESFVRPRFDMSVPFQYRRISPRIAKYAFHSMLSSNILTSLRVTP